jgi:hypothetical protein
LVPELANAEPLLPASSTVHYPTDALSAGKSQTWQTIDELWIKRIGGIRRCRAGRLELAFEQVDDVNASTAA